MCGISGITGQISDQPARVEKMLATIRHRGPDDHGIWHNFCTTLGAVRLAILDLSPTGHQPMSNISETIWIVYNGEMYNFQEEKNQLIQAGHKFKSNSDTEVILKLYEIYDNDFLNHIRGMFALAIYDIRPGLGKEKLLLARDPMGIKPLLYSIIDNSLIFASEMKAILASQAIPAQINPEALTKLLIYGSIPQPLTFIQNVHMLPSAHYLIYQNNQLSIEPYWHFDDSLSTKLSSLTYSELVGMLKNQLSTTVKRHLVSDVPVGAFLSGGIDSAALVALMSEVTSQRINTFSLGFDSEGAKIDESDRAQAIADHIGTNHTQIKISGTEANEYLRDFAKALDQPSVDGFNSFLIAKATGSKVKVAMSGLGGDELFAGYPWFYQLINFLNYSTYPVLRKILLIIATLAKLPLFNRWPAGQKISRAINKFKGNTDFVNKFVTNCQVLGESGARKLINPKIWSSLPLIYNPLTEMNRADELPNAQSIQRISTIILRTYTQNQLLRDIDTVSMYSSLEVRVPYLDIDLVNFVLNLPDKTKLKATKLTSKHSSYHDSGSKKILLDAVRHLLPSNIDQQPKLGFGLPLDAWLRTDMKSSMEELLSTAVIEKRGLFRVDAVQRAKKDFLSHRATWPVVWLPMIIELWCQEVLDSTN